MSTATDAAIGSGPQDSVERLGADLSRLKDDYPSKLTLDALARLSNTPKSTLSAALNGKKLPTPRTLAAIVTALDGEPQSWLDRRERLRLAGLGIELDESASVSPTTPSDAPAAPDPVRAVDEPTSAKLQPRWLLILLLIAALIVGGGIGAAITWTAIPIRDPYNPGIVKTGDDPAAFPDCLSDAVIAAAETRQTDYLLEIIWSAKCRAGWGRITRNDEKSYGNRIQVTTYRSNDPDGPDTQRSDDPDTMVSYTYLLTSNGPSQPICVKGQVTDGTQVIDLGTPLCL